MVLAMKMVKNTADRKKKCRKSPLVKSTPLASAMMDNHNGRDEREAVLQEIGIKAQYKSNTMSARVFSTVYDEI